MNSKFRMIIFHTCASAITVISCDLVHARPVCAVVVNAVVDVFLAVGTGETLRAEAFVREVKVRAAGPVLTDTVVTVW